MPKTFFLKATTSLATEDKADIFALRFISKSKAVAKSVRQSFKRNSSDDTSKDISDIEDFDLDDIDEDKEGIEKQAKDKDKQLEKDQFENMNFSFHHKSITS